MISENIRVNSCPFAVPKAFVPFVVKKGDFNEA
jgi:hypothetical protein